MQKINLTLLTLLLTATIFTIPSIAKANPSWAQGYYGNVNFELGQDLRIRQQRRTIRSLQDDLRQVENRLENTRREMAPLKKQKKNLQSTIETLKKEIANLKAKIEQAKAKLTDLNQRIQNNKQGLGKLRTNLAGAKKQVTSATNEVNLAKNNIATTKAPIERLSAKVKELQGKKKAAVQNCVAGGQTRAQCLNAPAVVQIVKKIQNKKSKLEEARRTHQFAKKVLTEKQTKLTQAKKRVKNIQTKIKNTNTKIAEFQAKAQAIKTNNQNRRTKIQNKKTQLANKQSILRNVVASLNPLKERAQRLKNRVQNVSSQVASASNELTRIRQKLIRRILEINSRAYNDSFRIAFPDGEQVAETRGQEDGTYDGKKDGHNDGTRIGKNREYRSGHEQGLIDGKIRADFEGKRDGRPVGTQEGNILAATREGKIAGENRAEKNRQNAEAIGQAQGEEDGLDRAVRTGKERGRPIGQKQGIEQFENRTLTPVKLKGRFVGTFSYNVPSFPGPTNRHFNSYSYCQNFRRELVNMACVEGYKVGYYNGAEDRYYQLISGIYDQHYTYAYNRAKDIALNIYYQASYNQGHVDGDKKAFTNWYSTFREEYRIAARDEFEQNPNRDSNEFKVTYKNVELNTFNTLTEEIRLASYREHEHLTFNNNIEQETNKAIVKRKNEVIALYTNNAVLDYVSFKLRDGGINGIAKADKVYQPGETVVFDLVIKNYALKEATNVQIILKDGSTTTIPVSIPGSSIATIKAASKTNISVTLGQGETFGIKASYKLTTSGGENRAVQGRHYYSRNSGEINSLDQKSVQVRYPLEISEVSTPTEMTLGEPILVHAKVTNKSFRDYSGPIEIQLSNSLGNSYISKEFANIESLPLNGVLNRTDAIISITDEDDAYRTMLVKGTLIKDGVTLGETVIPLRNYAKIKYIEKRNAPIVVVESSKTITNLKNLLKDVGGASKVSILDLDYRGANNSAILQNGFAKKTVVVLADSDMSNLFAATSKSIINSTFSFFAFADSQNSGAEKMRVMIPALAESYSGQLRKRAYRPYINFDFPGFGSMKVVSTNNVFFTTVKRTTTITQIDLDNITEIFTVADYFKMDPVTLFSNLKKSVTRGEDYITPSLHNFRLQKMVVFRLMEDGLKINTAAVKTAKKGFFGWKYNKKWGTYLENDQRLFIRQLQANQNTLAVALLMESLKLLIPNSTEHNKAVNIVMKIRSKQNKAFKSIYKKTKKIIKNTFGKDMRRAIKKVPAYKYSPVKGSIVTANGF